MECMIKFHPITYLMASVESMGVFLSVLTRPEYFVSNISAL